MSGRFDEGASVIEAMRSGFACRRDRVKGKGREEVYGTNPVVARPLPRPPLDGPRSRSGKASVSKWRRSTSGKQGGLCVTASDPSVRPFEPGDLPALQHIRQAAFEPVFRSFREIVGAEIGAIAFAHADAEQAQLLDDVCAAGSGHHMLVVTVGEAIAGFVCFSLDAAKCTGEIGLNAVHPDHAGRGLGTWMYEHVLARMK